MIFHPVVLIFANLFLFLVQAAYYSPFGYTIEGIKGLNPENDPIYVPITGGSTLNTEMDSVYCPEESTKSKSHDSSNECSLLSARSSGISSNNSSTSVAPHLNFSHSQDTPKPIDRQRFPDDNKTWGLFWGYPQDIAEQPVTWFRHLGKFNLLFNERKFGLPDGSVISLITHPYADRSSTNQTFYSMQYVYAMINRNHLFEFLFNITLKVFCYVTKDIVTAVVLEVLPNNLIKVNFIVNRQNEAKLNCPVQELLKKFSTTVSSYAPFNKLKPKPENDPIYYPIIRRWPLNTVMYPVHCPDGTAKSQSMDSYSDYSSLTSRSSEFPSNDLSTSTIPRFDSMRRNDSIDLNDSPRFPDENKIWGLFWGYPQDIAKPEAWLQHLGQFRYEFNGFKLKLSTGSVFSLISYPYANVLVTNRAFYSMEYVHVTIHKSNIHDFLFELSSNLSPYVTNDIIPAIVIEIFTKFHVKINFIVNRQNEARHNCSVKEFLKTSSLIISDYKSFSELK